MDDLGAIVRPFKQHFGHIRTMEDNNERCAMKSRLQLERFSS